MRSWSSVFVTDAKSKEKTDILLLHHSLYSLSNKMDNSLLAVRDINHKYIVVEEKATPAGKYNALKALISAGVAFLRAEMVKIHHFPTASFAV